MSLRTSVFVGDAPLVDILVSQVLPRAANTFLLGIPRRWRRDRMRLTVFVLAGGILMVSYDGLKLQWQYLFRTVVVNVSVVETCVVSRRSFRVMRTSLLSAAGHTYAAPNTCSLRRCGATVQTKVCWHVVACS